MTGRPYSGRGYSPNPEFLTPVGHDGASSPRNTGTPVLANSDPRFGQTIREHGSATPEKHVAVA